MSRRWTAEEDELLRERLGLVSLRTLSKTLQRSEDALKQRAYRLGINQKMNFWSANDVARLFGCRCCTVIRWIQLGLLAGRRSAVTIADNRIWHISDEAVEKFVQEHPERYDWRRMSYSYHRNLARDVHELDPVLSSGQVAEVIGISRNRVQTLFRQGQLQGVQAKTKPYGRPEWRIRKSALDRYLGIDSISGNKRCEVCGTPYESYGKAKYCSDDCRKKAIAKQRRAHRRQSPGIAA